VTAIFDFVFAFHFWSTTDRICSSAPARSGVPRCLFSHSRPGDADPVSCSRILDFQQERALPVLVPRSDFSPRARTAPYSRFVSHLDSRVLLVFVPSLESGDDSRVLLVFVPSLESGSGLNSIKLVLFYRFLFHVGFPVGFWGKHRSSRQTAIPACTVSPAQFLPPGFLLPLVFFVSVTRAHLESISCSVFILIFQS
jgi:hypothetical protein